MKYAPEYPVESVFKMAAGGSKQLVEVQEIERLKEELGELKEEHAEKQLALAGVKDTLKATKEEKKTAFKKL